MYLFVIFPDNEKFHVKAAVEMAVLVLHLDTYFGPCRTSIAELFFKINKRTASDRGSAACFVRMPRLIISKHNSYVECTLQERQLPHMSFYQSCIYRSSPIS